MQHATENDARRSREAEFHDRWAEQRDVDLLVDESFLSVTALENKHILETFGDVRGLSVLDFGCGAGEGGVYLAKLGARVVAMDVSRSSLELATQLAKRHGVEIETRLVQSDRIPAETSEFDRVYGYGVLHHVPLQTTIPELARVLKTTGIGCFLEPLPYNPLINIYRRIAKEVRTPDEEPLTFAQVDTFRRSFGHVSHREFWLACLGVFLKFYLWDRVDPNKERYWKKIYTDAPKLEHWFPYLRAFDDALLRAVPSLGYLCWTTVITIANPIKP